MGAKSFLDSIRCENTVRDEKRSHLSMKDNLFISDSPRDGYGEPSVFHLQVEKAQKESPSILPNLGEELV